MPEKTKAVINLKPHMDGWRINCKIPHKLKERVLDIYLMRGKELNQIAHPGHPGFNLVKMVREGRLERATAFSANEYMVILPFEQRAGDDQTAIEELLLEAYGLERNDVEFVNPDVVDKVQEEEVAHWATKLGIDILGAIALGFSMAGVGLILFIKAFYTPSTEAAAVSIAAIGLLASVLHAWLERK